MSNRRDIFHLAVAVRDLFTRKFAYHGGCYDRGLCAALDHVDTSGLSYNATIQLRRELYTYRDRTFVESWRRSNGLTNGGYDNFGYWWPLTAAGFRRRREVMRMIADKYRPKPSKKIDKRKTV